jgi:hypothetical protein
MCDLEGAVVTAAHAGERRRIRRRAACRIVEAQSERIAWREERPAHAERDAVQEIASRQGAQ